MCASAALEALFGAPATTGKGKGEGEAQPPRNDASQDPVHAPPPARAALSCAAASALGAHADVVARGPRGGDRAMDALARGVRLLLMAVEPALGGAAACRRASHADACARLRIAALASSEEEDKEKKEGGKEPDKAGEPSFWRGRDALRIRCTAACAALALAPAPMLPGWACGAIASLAQLLLRAGSVWGGRGAAGCALACAEAAARRAPACAASWILLARARAAVGHCAECVKEVGKKEGQRDPSPLTSIRPTHS